MKQVFNKSGKIIVEDVPSPSCGPKEILVANAFSLISPGTELESLSASSGNILSRIAEDPGVIGRAADLARKKGLKTLFNLTAAQMRGNAAPIGYSSSGIVVGVGSEAQEFSVGDRVSCAGAGIANHAEIVAVPKNLACRVPENVELRDAAFATVGAIALQGVRRADARLGETVAVIGLGLIGQLSCQILSSAGCNVLGFDLSEARAAMARKLGTRNAFVSRNPVKKVREMTGGLGADSVIICAAAKSGEPVRQATEMIRSGGRIVVVGSVDMKVDRHPLYEKEGELRISRSYGPGRYDKCYELEGRDYPIEYVRWTAKRNMSAFLELLSSGKVRTGPLVGCSFGVKDALKAYDFLRSKKPVGVVIEYPAHAGQCFAAAERTEKIFVSQPKHPVPGIIRVGLIGSGGIVRAEHLPNLKKCGSFRIIGVASRSGMSAKETAREAGAEYCAEDEAVIKDGSLDLIIIATRHDTHAGMALDALVSGKSVFVEKPMAMTSADAIKIVSESIKRRKNVFVGFNRRFSALSQKMKALAESHAGPKVISIRVSSTGMKKGHWINDPKEGGGAILGEGCHFFDLASWLAGSRPISVSARTINRDANDDLHENNMTAVISYADGSVASITYATMGDVSCPKEKVEVLGSGFSASMTDCEKLEVFESGKARTEKSGSGKGHFEMLRAIRDAMTGKQDTNRSCKDLALAEDGAYATITALAASESARNGGKEVRITL